VDVLLDPSSDADEKKYRVRPLRQWTARAFRWERGDISRVETMQTPEIDCFWQLIRKRLDHCRPLWIWCHQAATAATALGLWDKMDCQEYQLDEPYWRFQKRLAKNPRARQRKGFIADSDPPTIIHLWAHTGQQIKILDIRNWFRVSLEELKESLGWQPAENMLRGPATCETAAAGFDRLNVLYRAVTLLLEDIHRCDMGVMQGTAPAQAMSCYRHKFREHDIVCLDEKDLKEEVYQKARQLERDCYRGGRVEPFFVGTVYRCLPSYYEELHHEHCGSALKIDSPIYHLDVSGLYCSILRNQRLPYKLVGKMFNPIPRPEWTADWLNQAAAHVTIESTTTPYPRKEKDQTVWCTGRFKTFLCGPELVRAHLAGHLVAIQAATTYALATIASKFADYWWRVRCEAEDAGDWLCATLAKQMPNALTGKFAQRGRTWETVLGVPTPPDHRWGSFGWVENEKPSIRRGIAGVMQEQREYEPASHVFPAISAWVTAHGRCFMDTCRDVAGAGHVFYQSVDSLFTDRHGYDKLKEAGLVEERTLGLLRYVDFADYLRIWGVNDYQLGPKVVRAGVPDHAEYLADGRTRVEKMSHLRSYLDHGPGVSPTVWTETLAARGDCSRGILEPSGWVRPFERREG
jgi:hypothetical protein